MQLHPDFPFGKDKGWISLDSTCDSFTSGGMPLRNTKADTIRPRANRYNAAMSETPGESSNGHGPSYDPDQQVRAVHDMLSTLCKWRNAFKDSLLAAKKAGDELGYEECFYEAIYADAAFSHSAVSVLAPLFESIFDHESAAFKSHFANHLDSLVCHQRKRAPEQFWKYSRYLKDEGDWVGDIGKGVIQFINVFGIMGKFPQNFAAVVEALFTYRNCAFHGGFEWAVKRRKKFREDIDKNKWQDWFENSRSAGQPWMFMMTEKFVQTCFDMAIDTANAFHLAKFEISGRLRPLPIDQNPYGEWENEAGRLPKPEEFMPVTTKYPPIC
jgi:hypothetical protein